MMLGTMAAQDGKAGSGRKATTGARAGRNAAQAGPKAAPSGRKKSKLTAAGEEGSQLARRTLLLGTCEALKWNLARVAEVLELASHADVIRALKELAPGEYEAAKERGDIARRRDSERSE